MTKPSVDDELVRRFHLSGLRCAIAVTGGGSGLIGRLLEIPGGSNSILEVHVPYSEFALNSYLRQPPDQFCSEATALAMAAVALRRAGDLHHESFDACAGLGVTASLASSEPKRGPHRIHAAIQTPRLTISRSLELRKGARSRAEEEAVAAALAFSLLATTTALDFDIELLPDEKVIEHRADADLAWHQVRRGDADRIVWNETGEPRRRALVSGSFNPRHIGHDRLRNAAQSHLGMPVGFELAIVNADKPPLDDISLTRRLKQFDEPIVLTNAATFVEKSDILPETTFIIGMDTAVRVLDERFYPDTTVDMALAQIRRNGCRFLIAARHLDGEVTTIDDLAIPTHLADLFSAIPASQFLERISSTELRRSAGVLAEKDAAPRG